MSRVLGFLLCTLLLWGGTSHAANTHGRPDAQGELQSWFGAFSPHVEDNTCQPAVPTTSLTFAAFACNAYVKGALADLVYVRQAAATVTLANVNGVHWLAVCRDTSSTVAGWTRRSGTHYVHLQAATLPTTPTGCLITTQVTVAGNVITAVSPKFRTNPVGPLAGFSLIDPAIGAVCDGVTDDSAALQKGLNLGGKLVIPDGRTCIINTETAFNVEGTELVGQNELTSVLKTTAAVSMLRISAARVKLKSFSLDGNSIGVNGIVAHRANRAVVEDVQAHHFTERGIRINESWKIGAPDFLASGNNNIFKVIRGRYHNNGINGVGAPIRGDTTDGSVLVDNDQNGVEIRDVETNTNGVAGVLVKGTNWRITGGIHQSNTLYGIQIGHTTDTSNSVGTYIDNTWLEGNGTNGILLSAKGSQVYVGENMALQGVTDVVGGSHIQCFPTTSGSTGGWACGNEAMAWLIQSPVENMYGTNPGMDLIVDSSDGPTPPDRPDVALRLRSKGIESIYFTNVSNGPQVTSNGVILHRTLQTLTNDNATPDLSTGNFWHLTNANPTTITDITCLAGQILYISHGNGNTTWTDGGNLQLCDEAVCTSGSTPGAPLEWTATTNDTLTLRCDGTTKRELARSIN